jgi:hypothetical protein
VNDDDRLLERLARALRPPPREPAPERLAAVRARALAGPPRVPRNRVAPALLAAAVALLGAFVGGVVAAGDLPAPVRRAARAVGITQVDSPELVRAKEDLDELARALQRNDVPRIAAKARETRRSVAQVPPDERDEIEPHYCQLEVRSLDVLGQPAAVDPACLPTPPAAPAPSPAPTAAPTPFPTGSLGA